MSKMYLPAIILGMILGGMCVGLFFKWETGYFPYVVTGGACYLFGVLTGIFTRLFDI